MVLHVSSFSWLPLFHGALYLPLNDWTVGHRHTYPPIQAPANSISAVDQVCTSFAGSQSKGSVSMGPVLEAYKGLLCLFFFKTTINCLQLGLIDTINNNKLWLIAELIYFKMWLNLIETKHYFNMQHHSKLYAAAIFFLENASQIKNIKEECFHAHANWKIRIISSLATQTGFRNMMLHEL